MASVRSRNTTVRGKVLDKYESRFPVEDEMKGSEVSRTCVYNIGGNSILINSHEYLERRSDHHRQTRNLEILRVIDPQP